MKDVIEQRAAARSGTSTQNEVQELTPDMPFWAGCTGQIAQRGCETARGAGFLKSVTWPIGAAFSSAGEHLLRGARQQLLRSGGNGQGRAREL